MSSNAKINVCTYNTHTLRTGNDTNRLVEGTGNIRWHVDGLCDTKRRGEGLRDFSGWSWMCEAGKTEETPNAEGLVLTINKTFTDYAEKFVKHSDRKQELRQKANKTLNDKVEYAELNKLVEKKRN